MSNGKAVSLQVTLHFRQHLKWLTYTPNVQNTLYCTLCTVHCIVGAVGERTLQYVTVPPVTGDACGYAARAYRVTLRLFIEPTGGIQDQRRGHPLRL